MEMFSAPVIRSNLYVRPEVVIAGKKYMNTGSRFLCSFNPQPWSLEATEAWRRWCSTTAAIAGFMGSSRWFPREGSRGLVALWGTTGASGPPPLSGPGLWPQPQCPTGTAWSGGTSVGGGEGEKWLWHLSPTDGPLGCCQDKSPTDTDTTLWDSVQPCTDHQAPAPHPCHVLP